MSASETDDAASRLCTACGMCCNGVLFHIVRLQPDDSTKQLAALGMSLHRKKREPYFTQPCRFLQSCTCTIYAARPSRCRLFECRQVKRLAAHEITEADAMQVIDDAKRRVAGVESLLAKAGNVTVEQPLAERCAQVLADLPAAMVRDRLLAAMAGMNELLNAKFRLEAAVAAEPAARQREEMGPLLDEA